MADFALVIGTHIMTSVSKNHFLKIGDVFSRLGFWNRKVEYYKVIGLDIVGDPGSYDVLWCNKTGKEYKDRSSFGYYIDGYFTGESKENNQHVTYIGNFPITDKSYTPEGIKDKEKKRRIKYLKGVIIRHQKELEKLQNEI